MTNPFPDAGPAFTANPRSLAERMMNPTQADADNVAQLPLMRRDQVKMIVDKVLLEALRHLAAERDDFNVQIDPDATGWTVRIDCA